MKKVTTNLWSRCLMITGMKNVNKILLLMSNSLPLSISKNTLFLKIKTKYRPLSEFFLIKSVLKTTIIFPDHCFINGQGRLLRTPSGKPGVQNNQRKRKKKNLKSLGQSSMLVRITKFLSWLSYVTLSEKFWKILKSHVRGLLSL